MPKPSVTNAVFVNAPFEKLSGSKRGVTFEQIGRDVYSLYHQQVMHDCPIKYEKTRNTKCDWMHPTIDKELRVECKSSRMYYHVKQQKWLFSFNNVKRDHFDVCVLVAYFPNRLEVWLWNGKGYSTSGVKTATQGGSIVVSGRKGKDWDEFDSPHQVIGELFFDDMNGEPVEVQLKTVKIKTTSSTRNVKALVSVELKNMWLRAGVKHV